MPNIVSCLYVVPSPSAFLPISSIKQSIIICCCLLIGKAINPNFNQVKILSLRWVQHFFSFESNKKLHHSHLCEMWTSMWTLKHAKQCTESTSYSQTLRKQVSGFLHINCNNLLVWSQLSCLKQMYFLPILELFSKFVVFGGLCKHSLLFNFHTKQ